MSPIPVSRRDNSDAFQATLDELGPTRPNKALRKPMDPADILAAGAATFRERNALYGSNYRMVAPMVRVLFPDGVPPELVTRHEWHLFELMLVKLSRFAISNLRHEDSVHDLMVYAAMIESILKEEQRQ
jgi:hypothetical protein